jgi:hypothetical protein
MAHVRHDALHAGEECVMEKWTRDVFSLDMLRCEHYDEAGVLVKTSYHTITPGHADEFLKRNPGAADFFRVKHATVA